MLLFLAPPAGGSGRPHRFLAGYTKKAALAVGADWAVSVPYRPGGEPTRTPSTILCHVAAFHEICELYYYTRNM